MEHLEEQYEDGVPPENPLAHLDVEGLSQLLYTQPPTHPNYGTVREELRNRLMKVEKYQDYVLVYPSLLHKPPRIDKSLNIANTLYGYGLMDSAAYDWSGVTATLPLPSSNPFNTDDTFLESEFFDFVPRYAIEYNPMFIQVVAVVYITDGKNVIMLRSTDATRIKNKLTFIQGHVDYSPDAYLRSQPEFIRDAAIRELTEEIIFDNDKDRSMVIGAVSENPRFFIRTKNNHIDIEHFGCVFEVEVPDATGLFNRIKTGEHENHEVTLISLHDVVAWSTDGDSTMKELDNWALPVIKRLAHLT